MIKSKAILFLLLTGVFFLFLIKAEFFPFAAKTYLGKDIKLYTYTAGDTLLGSGTISVPFRRSKNGETYLNVAVDFNGDGKYSGYLIGGKTQEEWIAKNEKPRILSDYRNNFSFLIVDNAIGVRTKFPVKTALTDHKLTSFWTTVDPQKGEFIISSVPLTRHDLGSFLGFDIPGADPEIKRGFAANTSYQNFLPQIFYIGKAKASSNSDFEVYRQAQVPDFPQQPTECTPTAVANNMVSLAGEHGRLNDLPKTDREIIAELKSDMQFNSGVTNNNLVSGKDKFSARHKLPIATKRIDHPSFQDMVDAIKSGAAVELSMKWVKSKSGHADTGHVVNLVGAGSTDGAEFVYVHDPATPLGMDTLNLSFKIQRGSTSYEGIEYPAWDGIAYIDEIFVQKWTNQPQQEITTVQLQEVISPSITKSPSPLPTQSSPTLSCDLAAFFACRDIFNLQGCIDTCPLVSAACAPGTPPDTECKETEKACADTCWNKGNEHGSSCAAKNNCTIEEIDKALRS